VSKERLYEVNAIGTRNIFEAAIENKVTQFIHVSSCDIYGALTYIPADIDHPKNPKNNYAWSKLEAEKIIRNHPDRNKITSTIIRPSMLYGPRSEYVAAILFSVPVVLRYLGITKLPYFRGGTKVTLVHVEDVSGSIVFSLFNEKTYNKTFNIAEEEIIEMGTIIELLLKNFGIKPLCTIPLSKFFLNLGSSLLLALPNCISAGILSFFVVRMWKRIVAKYDLKKDFYPKLHKEFYSYFFGDRVFSIDDIQKAGYIIKHKSIRYSLGETITWYKKNKWLPDFNE
jgi:nucleoside-diphosphate-sugar epimerase